MIWSQRSRPDQQARVTVGIKAIARFDRVRIGPPDRIEPAEGARQHDKRGARQMEIGHQHVDRAEAVAGGDEDRGFAGERMDAEVVPTQTMRPPFWRVVLSAAAVAASTAPSSACIA